MLPPAIGFWVFGFGILGLLAIVLWVLGIADIVRRPDLERNQRWAWILLVVLLPLVGTAIYFARRPTLPDEREKIIAAQTRRH